MPLDVLIARLLDEGGVTGVYYGEMEKALFSVGYETVGTEGPYRTFKHRGHRKLLTIRDGGAKHMYSGYIRMAAQHLRSVQENGGLNDIE